MRSTAVGGHALERLVHAVPTLGQRDVQPSGQFESLTYVRPRKKHRRADRSFFTLVEEFVLPREEARQLFRSYNHVWNLQIDEHQIQRVCDSCARNGLVRIDDALKQLAR